MMEGIIIIMCRITFEDFCKVMSYDVAKKQGSCIEIEFCVDGCAEYQSSWLGKTIDKEAKEPIFWFGLTEDGSQGYDYDSFENFSNAKVFHEKSIKEIWDSVSLRSIDACNVQERLLLYLGHSLLY